MGKAEIVGRNVEYRFYRGVEVARFQIYACAFYLHVYPCIGNDIVAYLLPVLSVEGSEHGIPSVGIVAGVVTEVYAGL